MPHPLNYTKIIIVDMKADLTKDYQLVDPEARLWVFTRTSGRATKARQAENEPKYPTILYRGGGQGSQWDVEWVEG